MPSFMLDSNVWEKVVAPQDYQDGIHYQGLLHKISTSVDCSCYLSSVIFDLEDISKKDRLQKFRDYVPSVKVEHSLGRPPNELSLKFTIEPGPFHFDSNEYLERHASAAFGLGMKVAVNLRTALPINPLYSGHELYPTEEQNNKAGEVASYIEKNIGSGLAAIYSVCDKFSVPKSDDLMQTIQGIPDNAVKDFVKAIAEWADADALATCIGMGFDYFVTNDKAGNAGTKSVFSTDNINKLKVKYPSLNIIDPKEMLAIIQAEGNALK